MGPFGSGAKYRIFLIAASIFGALLTAPFPLFAQSVENERHSESSDDYNLSLDNRWPDLGDLSPDGSVAPNIPADGDVPSDADDDSGGDDAAVFAADADGSLADAANDSVDITDGDVPSDADDSGSDDAAVFADADGSLADAANDSVDITDGDVPSDADDSGVDDAAIFADADGSLADAANDSVDITDDDVPSDADDSGVDDATEAYDIALFEDTTLENEPPTSDDGEGIVPDDRDALDPERVNTIRFGIDGQLGALIDILIAEGDERYGDLLLRRYDLSSSNGARVKIFDYFIAFQLPDAEDIAAQLFERRSLVAEDLLAVALRYVRVALQEPRRETITALYSFSRDRRVALTRSALAALEQHGDSEDVDYLIGLLNLLGRDEDSLAVVIDTLGSLKAEAASDTILSILRSQKYSEYVRRSAAIALGNLGDPIHLEELRRYVDDSSAFMRAAAVDAVGNIESPESVPLLERGLLDSYAGTRIAALEHLGRRDIGFEAVRFKAMSDPDTTVRNAAWRALVAMNNSEAAGMVENALLKEDESFATRTVIAAALLADPGNPKQRMLRDLVAIENDRKNYRMTNWIASQLSKYEPPVELLSALLAHTDEATRFYAVGAIESETQGDFRGQLDAIAREDDSERVRQLATDALDRLYEQR